MAKDDLSLALAVLRVIRGWTQDDLAKASGLPKKLISDYERGTKVPELKSVERLLAAMGCSIEAFQSTRRLVQAVRSGGVHEMAEELPPSSEPFEDLPAVGDDSLAALHWEVEQLAAESRLVANRLTRVMLILMSRVSRPGEIPGAPL